MPNPAIMLASIAQRTKRLRLGTAISILTFHNPLTVAESYAMAISLDSRLCTRAPNIRARIEATPLPKRRDRLVTSI